MKNIYKNFHNHFIFYSIKENDNFAHNYNASFLNTENTWNYIQHATSSTYMKLHSIYMNLLL